MKAARFYTLLALESGRNRGTTMKTEEKAKV
jgi:hypothetical protein